MMKKIFILLGLLTLYSSSLSAQWSNLGLSNLNVKKIMIISDTAYAATSDGFYKKSISNNDTIWIAFGLQGKEITDFILFNNLEIIASVYEHPISLYKTNNGGSTWIDFQNGFGGTSGSNICFSIDAHPLYQDTLYARGSMNVAKSTDRGQSWQSVYADWGTMGYQSRIVQIDRNNPNIIWAGGEISLFQAYLLKSTDYGHTWQYIANEINPEGNNASNCLFINPINSNDVFVGMEGRIMRSLDGGSHWDTIFVPDAYTYILDMDVSPNNSNLIYAVGSENGTLHGDLLFYKSNDFGTIWDTERYLDSVGVYLVADLEIIKTGSTDELYFSSERGVYKYSNPVTNIDENIVFENEIELTQNYPNPFNISTTISYSLPVDQHIKIKILNVMGEEVAELINRQVKAGIHKINFNGNKLSSGIYFYKIEANNFSEVRKLILLK